MADLVSGVLSAEHFVAKEVFGTFTGHLEMSYDSNMPFLPSILPLVYDGPSVRIQLQPSNKEYRISKELLCAESPVFAKMFNGEFLESQQMATLEETEDDVSVHSLEGLIQWLHLRAVRFEIKDPKEHVSAAIQLTRLADKYNIAGLESVMARYIKNLLISNTSDDQSDWDANANTICLTSDHIASATLLPQGHPVRRFLASACVAGYLQTPEHKFSEETQMYPSFGADMLREVRLTLQTAKSNLSFEDPLSQRKYKINSAL